MRSNRIFAAITVDQVLKADAVVGIVERLTYLRGRGALRHRRLTPADEALGVSFWVDGIPGEGQAAADSTSVYLE